MQESLNQYEQERRAKLEKLKELGVDPFGGAEESLSPLGEVKAKYTPEMGHDAGPVVKVAGRVVFRRDFGKLSFIHLRDDTEKLQIAIDKKRVDELSWKVGELLDLGDQIVCEGKLGTTKTGEVTVWCSRVAMSAKSLLSPPGKWDGLSDVELRYRQRYVDLWANPEVMQTIKLRIAIIDEMRAYLKQAGYLEVETPMMQPLAGGAAARPFKTHHNALDMPLFLRIAPELYLKRLLVGGFRKVFEINRNFRNEGISPRHNPEFTMLEAYAAYGSWQTMADLVEDMVCTIAEKVLGTLRIEHKDPAGQVTRTIDLTRPWQRVSMVDLVFDRTGWKFDMTPFVPVDPLDATPQQQDGSRALQALAKAHDFHKLSPAEQLTTAYEKLIEPTLIDPTFVTQVPSVIIPLARKNKENPFFADVYELAINGQEISPGYSELNDPDVQAENFRHQVGDKDEQQQIDEDFLSALKYGMPPAGGMGLGIDRLVMMLLGAASIRDVILFPLMRI